MDKSTPRFVGIDLHKHFAIAAAVNAEQRLVLPPTPRLYLDEFPAWASTHLRPTDVVAFEATGNAWWLYDLVSPLVARTVVANSLQVKWIAHAAVKTDKHDAIRLAKLLAANLLPPVWGPPPHVRELRAVLAHRRALVKQRTAVKNRLHSVLHRQSIALPNGDPFAAQQRAWWLGLDLSPTERLRLCQDLDTLDHIERPLDAVDKELARLSNQPPWAHAMPFLVQLPGLALSAMRVWGHASTTVAKRPTMDISPKRDDVICGACSSKRRGVPSPRIRIGSRNLHASLVANRRALPL